MKFFTWVFALHSFALCHAQANFSNWHFGNGACLTFNAANVEACAESELYTDEGCSAISDQNGNLIFYTNGVFIWNKNHKKINPNQPLFGHLSSTQSVQIVAHPSKANQYFLFTVSEKADYNGFNYHLIEVMDQNTNQRISNKGLVTPDISSTQTIKIIKKNQTLSRSVCEKLIAAPHADQKSVWIITHIWNSNGFIAYLLDSKGKIKQKVISEAGAWHKNLKKFNKSESIGQMKVSPNAKRLALAISYREDAPIELFTFNNTTGKIELEQALSSKGNAYGIEFSPDNSKLYVSYLEGPQTLVQYDLHQSGLKTTLFVNDNEEISYGALQLGPDQKIYLTKTTTFMDVIESPNASGKSCNFKLSKINLRTKFGVYGLPSKPINTFRPAVLNNPIKKETNEALHTTLGDESYLLDTPSDCRINLSDKTVKCENSIDLSPGGKNVNYRWSSGETTPSITVSNSDYYAVTLTGNNCKKTKKIYVDFSVKPTRFLAVQKFNPKSPFNNFFSASLNDIEDFKIQIFKPKSQKVLFESENPLFKWYGKNQKGTVYGEGDYAWVAEYTEKCSGIKKEKTGKVTLSFSKK